jgi:PAS domain S-box-containing protein
MAGVGTAQPLDTHAQPYSGSHPPRDDGQTQRLKPAQRSLAALLVANVALACIYIVAGKLALTLATVHASASAVWPPTGIAVAALLLFGYHLWPAIAVGAFLVNLFTAGSAASSLGVATGNTLEALLAVYLVNRFANGRRVFDRLPDILKFALFAGVVAPSVSATLGVTTLASLGYADWSRYGPIWLTWWLGDMGGAIVVAPLLVLWGLNPRPRWSGRQTFEVGLLLLALFVVGEAVFGGFGGILSFAAGTYPLPYMVVPLLVWAALRFGQREVATLIFLVSALANSGALHGLGPFVREPGNEALLLLQVFSGMMAVMALALAGTVAEHKRAEEALQDAHGELERRVRERTAELVEAESALRREIEVRRHAYERLRESERQLLEAQKLAQLGSWTWDVATNTLICSEQFYRMHGVTPETFGGTYQALLDRVHPDDRARADEILAAAARDRQPFDFYHRIVWADGTERIMRKRGQAVLDEAGRLVGVVGTAQDVSELKRTEDALQRARAELERRVEERTRELAEANAALQGKIADLEKLEEVVVGRELRMIELEKELDRLRRVPKESEGRPIA